MEIERGVLCRLAGAVFARVCCLLLFDCVVTKNGCCFTHLSCQIFHLLADACGWLFGCVETSCVLEGHSKTALP